jgi:hypothetical protein
MLMRLLARFDRLRERRASIGSVPNDDIDDIALLDAAGERARHAPEREHGEE